jgi:hypothetical protein
MFNGAVVNNLCNVTWESYRKDFVCVKLKPYRYYPNYSRLDSKFCLYPVFKVDRDISAESQLLTILGFLRDKPESTFVWLECPTSRLTSDYVTTTLSIIRGFKGTDVKFGVKCEMMNTHFFGGVTLWVSDFNSFSTVSNVVFRGDDRFVEAIKIV